MLLVIDPEDALASVTVLSDPENGVYRAHFTVMLQVTGWRQIRCLDREVKKPLVEGLSTKINHHQRLA
ncbi:hypothetical protein, partial [Sphaerisporangium album]|uniref:hypothetical protein n=1 Tax=Sphaerisporangium album TaxID=509200 RepID=UPI0011C0336B